MACATQPLTAGITVHTTTPGSLDSELGNQALTIDKLTVTGPLDASDFVTMWHCAYRGALVDIDLSAALIVDATIPPYAFFHPDEQLTPEGFTPLKLRSLTLPSDIVEIGQGALAYTRITAVGLPKDLELLGTETFSGCTQLTGTVTIPDKVTVIPADCFRGCVAMDGVRLPAQLRSIEPGAFADCGIRTIDIPKGVRFIGHSAFLGARRLTTVAIPNSCTRIDAWAFSRCLALEYLQLPDNLTVIPEELASHCPKLLTVDLPGNLTGIDADAFRYCTSLRSVHLPETLEYIATRAFEYSGIDYIVLTADIKSVGQGFISHCTNLKAVYCVPVTPPVAGEDPSNADNQQAATTSIRWTPFHAVDENLPVYVPKGCIDTYRTAWGWSVFTNYNELPAGFDPHNVDAVSQLHLGIEAPRITSEAGRITLTAGISGTPFHYTIHTMDGRAVATGQCSDTVTVPCPPAIYIVKAGVTTLKIAVK